MKSIRTKLISAVLLCVAVAMFVAPISISVSARTLDEIQADIDAQNAKLVDLQKQLQAAQANLNNLQGNLNSSRGQIPQLQAQIDQITATIQYNGLQMQMLSDQQTMKQLETEQKQKEEDRAMKNAYLNWRSDSKLGGYLLSDDYTNPIKNDIYQSQVMDTQQLSIEELQQQLSDIGSQLDKYKTATEALNAQNADLSAKKAQLEAQILALQSSISGTKNTVSGLQSQSNVVQSTITQLSAEQKALQDYEAWILGQSGNGGTNELQAGQYYFTGVGRELYQGHGVGMSQWGAYGAALAGWSYAQILTKYYTGVQISTMPANINVEGYGSMDANTYAAGQAEVPGRACGSAEQAAARPDKYVVDNPNTPWDCWPEEAVKAQVIAFRTYAINYGGTICTDARCQVYNGSTYSQWAVDETRDLVVTYNGHAIEALYSSDNSNGWGTANNETRFSGLDGEGTPEPYLRAVQDNGFATPTTWTNWSWRTNGYSLNDFNSLLTFASNDAYLTSGSRSFVSGIVSGIGTVSAITFGRDPSGRVAKVYFTGTNGVTRQMAGWFFKTIWNSWVDQVQPSGQKDFIYSLTYFLLVS